MLERVEDQISDILIFKCGLVSTTSFQDIFCDNQCKTTPWSKKKWNFEARHDFKCHKEFKLMLKHGFKHEMYKNINQIV